MSESMPPTSRPPAGDAPRSEGPRGDRPPRRDEGSRPGGGFRRDGDRRDRPPMSVKARLRAKARKKARKQRKGKTLRKKLCRFCADPKAEIDYRDPKGLRYFITETGKVIPMRISGNCARHQRKVALAIKRARQLALMPYAPHHVN